MPATVLRTLIRRAASFCCAALILIAAVELFGQANSPSLTVLAREGRRQLTITPSGSQELIALDDLASAFQLAVREEAGAITVSYKGKTIVLTSDQPLASVAGRLISLPVAPAKINAHWLVPVEFVSRALALVYDTRLDLRRTSHLLVVGDLRVPKVTVRSEPIGTGTRLTIDATPRAGSTIMQDAQRLTIVFDADAIDAAVAPVQPDGLLTAIRVVEPSSLVVEIGPRFATFRATNEAVDTTARLTIDLTASAPVNSGTSAPAPPPEPPPLTPPSTPIRSVTIDPGHGGDDVGAKGAGGLLEKDLTLAVARRLKGAIESRLGIRVILTRDDDRAIPVDDRTSVANNNKADFFISLHANASFRSATSGASIYLAAFDQSETAAAPLLPERVPTFGGGLRDIELVPWNLAQIRYLDQSQRAADILQQQLQDHVPLDKQPIVHAPARVLESANMPAILVEMGYLSNAEQEKQMGSPDFQGAITQALYDTVVKFRDALGVEGGQ